LAYGQCKEHACEDKPAGQHRRCRDG
ncbi:hypothetical protein A2U01_0091246, partial [Trifolium medium]|nr:hypothetical protein [Trifolium medium]